LTAIEQDICDFQGGTQPPKNEWSKEPSDKNIRMLQIRDFTQPGKDNIEYVRKTKNLKLCNADDILIGRYGASVGKILTGLSGAYNVAIIKTIPNESLLSKIFLFHLLKGPNFQSFINAIGARAAQAGFNKIDLSKFSIALLPIDDQIRIATLLSRVEAMIAKRKENLRLLDEFLKSTFLEMFGPTNSDFKNGR
jgi:type I restriction enzyme S subunit